MTTKTVRISVFVSVSTAVAVVSSAVVSALHADTLFEISDPTGRKLSMEFKFRHCAYMELVKFIYHRIIIV